MRLPIIINDSAQIDSAGDLRVYDSLEAAERSCEPPDADDPSLHAFDIDGRRLQIVSRGVSHVSLTLAEQTPTHRDVVERLLADFAAKWKPEIDPAGKSVEEIAWAIFDADPNAYSGTATRNAAAQNKRA